MNWKLYMNLSFPWNSVSMCFRLVDKIRRSFYKSGCILSFFFPVWIFLYNNWILVPTLYNNSIRNQFFSTSLFSDRTLPHTLKKGTTISKYLLCWTLYLYLFPQSCNKYTIEDRKGMDLDMTSLQTTATRDYHTFPVCCRDQNSTVFLRPPVWVFHGPYVFSLLISSIL